MTQEDKKLLLRDLCARLPYGVKINHQGYTQELTVIVLEDIIYSEHEVKPYLRPLSSMIEEEKKFYKKYFNWYEQPLEDMVELIDWLNAHHFDYRGLIDKGLALEATEDMYK